MAYRRAGFTLVEVIVTILVIVVLGAVMLPNLLGPVDRARVDQAIESLDAFNDAMTTARDDNQDWPGRLSHLAWPITTSDTNICGDTYAQGKVNNWAGPYLDRNVPASGVPIGIGVAQDSLVRQVISGQDGYLIIQVTGVTEEDAEAVNREFDADGDPAGGSIRWTAPDASGLVRLDFYRPIRGC